jgi:hypothetical protein
MNKNEDFLNFQIFYGILTQFLNNVMIPRVTTFCNAKVLTPSGHGIHILNDE